MAPDACAPESSFLRRILRDEHGPLLLKAYLSDDPHFAPCTIQAALDRHLDGGSNYRIAGILTLNDCGKVPAYVDGKREQGVFVVSQFRLRSDPEIAYGRPGFLRALGGDPDRIFPATYAPLPLLERELALATFWSPFTMPELFALEDALASETLRELPLENVRNDPFHGVRRCKEEDFTAFSKKGIFAPYMVVTEDGEERHGYLRSRRGEMGGFVALEGRSLVEAEEYEESPRLSNPLDIDYDHRQVKLGGKRVCFFQPKRKVSGFPSCLVESHPA